MRIRREAFAADLLAEEVELLFADAALEKRARVETWRRVALQVHEIAAECLRRRAEEVVEADVVERRRRREARDVAAEFRTDFVGPYHHRERVPAYVVAQTRFQLEIAGDLGLLFERDRIDVRRFKTERDRDAAVLRFVDEPPNELARAVGTLGCEHAAHRVDPFLGFLRVRVVPQRGHRLRTIPRPPWISCAACSLAAVDRGCESATESAGGYASGITVTKIVNVFLSLANAEPISGHGSLLQMPVAKILRYKGSLPKDCAG